MRYLVFLVCFAIALGGCASHPSPAVSPTATEVAQAPSPTPTVPPTETTTPTPTATPSPTSTKTPTPEPTATPTPEIQRVVYLEDNFSGTNRAVFEGPNPHYEGDALYFTFAEEGGGLWASRRFPLSNFRLEASLAGDGAYGLNFGGIPWEGKINYDLVLEKSGYLLLNWYKGDVFQGGLFDARVISPSQREGFHTFGLDYDGKKLILFFDGEKVGEVSKTSLHGGLEEAGGNGQIGLFSWDEGGKDVGVGIDSLTIKLPQELIPTPTPIAPIPTPEPTETPRVPVCEIPHWPEEIRTEGRSNGIIMAYGKPFHEIYHPDSSPYAPYDNGAYWMNLAHPGYEMVWVREAQIVSIDKENRIVKFYVGRGQYVQRRVTEKTRIIMAVSTVYKGMPSLDAYQFGGNFCDLKANDLAGLLHRDFGEAVNLNPELIDLEDLLIVQ